MRSTLFQSKQANPAATAVNNAGKGHESVPLLCDPTKAPDFKAARETMHDDSGAQTGLRNRPDYGESDSYTSEMNKANSKGASTGYVIELNGLGKAASYVASVTYDEHDSMKLAKFAFSADREKALVLPNLMANDIARQISGPEFGMRAVVAAAVDYSKMFTAFQSLVPKKYDRNIQAEIQWARDVLKKQDRIIWYLRIFRLGLVREAEYLAKEREAHEESKKTPIPAQVQQPQQASLRKKADPPGAAPAQEQQTLTPEQQPQQAPVAPRPMLTLSQRLGKLREKYVNEMKAKGTPSDGLSPDLGNLPNMKGNLEHFYSLPIPAIQNTVLAGQSYGTLISAFRQAEEEWQEKAVRLVRPLEDDKIWMKFPNGWAWWWLPRAACDLEAKAMGHCGNSPRSGRTDQTILSLREPVQYGNETLWEPHLTFVLHNAHQGDDGTLGEMKGRNNDKPIPAYHPYIVALLKDPRIHGFVGATWMKENNFSMMDLTEEQREEVFAANPHLEAGGIERYYKQHGMDETLVGRIRSVLNLDEDATYNKDYGFILHKWTGKEDFVMKEGDTDAKKAWKMVKGGETPNFKPVERPSDDTLVEFAMDYGSEKVIGNIGRSLANEFPKEAKEWFGDAQGAAWADGGWEEGDYGFDPDDKDQVKRFFELLMEPTYTGDKAVYPTEPRRHGKPDKSEGDTSKYKYREIKVLETIQNAYNWGLPNIDMVKDLLDDAITAAMGRQQDGTRVVENKETGELYQVMPEKDAVALAQKHALEETTARDIHTPDVTIASGWDTWNDEQATEGLADYFQTPMTFKRPEDKRQKRLFKEPKTVEEAQQKGIPITHNSSLKSPLWWA